MSIEARRRHTAPMRLAVVDDEALARTRLQRLLAAMADVELVASCDGAEALLQLLRTEPLDALLLDVRMPGLDGIELAALLRDNRVGVVFVTAHAEHAVDAFELGAVDYLLKPVAAARLRTAIDRLRQRQVPARQGSAQPVHSLQRLAVETASGVVLVQPQDIVHAAFDGHLVTLHVLAEGALKPLLTSWSLQQLSARLPTGLLERVQRRALLNLHHVQRLERASNGGYVACTVGAGRVAISRQAGRRLRKLFDW